MSFILTNVSNRRFLTTESIGLSNDWFDVAKELQAYVSQSPKLNLYDHSINIFLLQSPEDVEVEDMDSLICVPITGHEVFEDEDEVQLLDLDAGGCWQLEKSTDIGNWSSQDLTDFLENQYRAAKKAVDDLATTWMLKIFYDEQSQSMRVDIQFFPEI